MADLNTNNYSHIGNQPAYGNNDFIPVDDKKLRQVKQHITRNPVGKALDNVVSAQKEGSGEEQSFSKKYNIPITLGLGSIITVAMSKALSAVIGGDKLDFDKSLLGRAVKKIDDVLPKFEFKGIKKFLAGNQFIQQLKAGSSSCMPKFGPAKSLVAPPENLVVKELVDEAIKIQKLDFKPEQDLKRLRKSVQDLIHPERLSKDAKSFIPKNTLKKNIKNYAEAVKKAGANPEKKLKALQTLHRSLFEVDVQAKLSSYSANLEDVIKNKPDDVIKVKTAYQKAVESIEGKTVSSKFKNLRNRADALMNRGNKSLLSKLLIRGHNALNRITHLPNMKGNWKAKLMGAGAFAFIAYIFGEMAKKSIDAPEGEKGSTFAHSTLVEFCAGWMLFDPLTRGMYKTIGALKNLSPIKDPLLKKDNFLLKAIKAPLRLAGNICSIGLGNKSEITPAKSLGGKIVNGFKRNGKFLKGVAGFGLRVGIVLNVLFPAVEAVAKKVVHGIFGRPEALLKEEALEEEGGEEKSEETGNAENNQMLTVAEKRMLPAQNSGSQYTVTPMVQRELEKRIAENKMIPAQNSGSQHTVTPMVQRELEKRIAENKMLPAQNSGSQHTGTLAGTELKMSDINSDLNKLYENNARIQPAKEIAAAKAIHKHSYSYIPSAKKNPESPEKRQHQTEYNAALLKTDKAIEEAQNVLG